MTTVSPLTLTGNSDSSDRRTTLAKRRTQTPSTGYEPKGTVVPDEELMLATTPRTTAKLRRTCSEDYKDLQFDALDSEMKSIGERYTEALQKTYSREICVD
eukprot:4756745-Amphidinium_carterae.1